LKIIDKFLLKSFIPPFIVSFGIALFVLVMQVLWVYIDEIMGKGLTIFELTELIFYLSMTLVPMGFPIAVLISTVMVMGNLAEKYELSSLKSAGIGLVRILRPMMLACGLITVISIFVSEEVIPWANLKFYSRFYDIRRSKPTLTMQEGVFNDEFRDYTMRIGKKGKDNRSLENVMVFSNRSTGGALINQTTAKKGEMFTTSDKQFIIMNLFDGVQFQETQGSSNTGNKTYPFIRIKYKSWQKIFDLSEFERRRTNEELFQNHQKMKNSWELKTFADSIIRTGESYINEMKRSVGEQFTLKEQGIKHLDSLERNLLDTLKKTSPLDTPSVKKAEIAQNTSPAKPKKRADVIRDSFTKNSLAGTPFDKKASITTQVDTQAFNKVVANFYDFDKGKKPYEIMSIYTMATVKARTSQNAADNAVKSIDVTRVSAGKFIYEMHLKYNYAVICFVFLFIGAPMGAIIQKGGFGMPILVAIAFFMVFMVSNIYCKNLRNSNELSATMAAWLPVFVMIPIAAILTYRALNDYKFINFDPLKLVQSLNPRTFLERFRRKLDIKL
jgi:lipopolysaccharide export system permease protein